MPYRKYDTRESYYREIISLELRLILQQKPGGCSRFNKFSDI